MAQIPQFLVNPQTDSLPGYNELTLKSDTFSQSGSWAVPKGVKQVWVKGVGGGGGGGNRDVAGGDGASTKFGGFEISSGGTGGKATAGGDSDAYHFGGGAPASNGSNSESFIGGTCQYQISHNSMETGDGGGGGASTYGNGGDGGCYGGYGPGLPNPVSPLARNGVKPADHAYGAGGGGSYKYLGGGGGGAGCKAMLYLLDLGTAIQVPANGKIDVIIGAGGKGATAIQNVTDNGADGASGYLIVYYRI